MRIYEVVSKVMHDGELIGYKLKPVTEVANVKDESFYKPLNTIILEIEKGFIQLKGVKLTKQRTLRGCDGFLLSRVPEVSIKNLPTVNADLLSVLVYVMKQLYTKPYKETNYGAEVRGLTAYYYVDTRSEDYYNMTHMDATDDLSGSLEFYKEHLPKELEGKIDDIYGEVGEKGYLRITVYKNLEV